MSAARDALADAREDFARFSNHCAAADLLDAAFTAWNESELSECDYVDEVQSVARWLRRKGDEERARARTHARAAS